MKEFTYYTMGAGICPSKMIINVNDDYTFENVTFFGGCAGNHEGINVLCKGMKAQDIIDKLKNVRCRARRNSCPSELAVGLEYMLKHWEEMQTVEPTE